MEALVNDKLLEDNISSESSQYEGYLEASDISLTSSNSRRLEKTKYHKKCLNVSSPVEPYSVNLKNFWYPVGFFADLNDDTMVMSLGYKITWGIKY